SCASRSGTCSKAGGGFWPRAREGFADGAAGAGFCSAPPVERGRAHFWACCADAGPAIVAARIVAAKIVVARIVMARLTSNAASIHRRCILWRSRAANVYHIIEGSFAERAVARAQTLGVLRRSKRGQRLAVCPRRSRDIRLADRRCG